MRFLVLLGNAERRKELVALLRGAEHGAVAAADADSAAEAIGSSGFDALVLDLALPQLEAGILRRAISPADVTAPDSLEQAERRHLAQVLKHTSGNKRKAAQLLGISRSTLLNKVRKYGLER